MSQNEIHLFLIWEYARKKESDILKDISASFKILDVYDITWSQELFASNLTRFYGQNLPPNSHKELHCGKGSFLVIIVEDINPIYLERNTSHGVCFVNINMFDKKQLYREWTGGGHKIHATDNVPEVNNNLILLIGLNLEDYLKERYSEWDKTIQTIVADPPGARGWNSIRDLFYILNSTVDYVVLRNFEGLPDQYTMKSHGDIDFLTTNPIGLKYIINALPVFPETPRVLHYAMVNGEKVLFDFRFVGDDYYDKKWEEDILKNRILSPNGFYRPDNINHFYSLLYHALVHKQNVVMDYQNRLPKIANTAGINISSADFNEPLELNLLLSNFLKSHNYRYTDPNDISVYLKLANTDITSISLARIFSFPINIFQKVSIILQQTQDCSVNSKEFKKPVFRKSHILKYHFSPYRHLPVKIATLTQKSTILEIGAETGVVTRYLGEEFDKVVTVEKNPDAAETIKIRCRDLSNVKVLCSSYSSLELSEKFDAAVVIINLNQDKNFTLLKAEVIKKLTCATAALKDSGKLIFAIENNDAYRNRYVENKFTGFTTKEINELLLFLKLKYYYYYYPFPDHIFGQNYLTDEACALKSSSIGQWMGSIPSYEKNGDLISIDKSLEFVKQKAIDGDIGKHSNSFLIIASKNEHSKPKWFIKGYNREYRREEAWTETSLVEGDNNLVVVKTGKEFYEPPFCFKPNSKTPFFEGETLENLLIDAINSSDHNTFFQLFTEYCNYLIVNYSSDTTVPPLSGAKDLFLKGETFDLISSNIIVNNGKWYDFDKEWQTILPVPLSLVCFRSLLVLILKVDITNFSKKLNISEFGQGTKITDIIALTLSQLPLFDTINGRLCDLYLDDYAKFESFTLNSRNTTPSFIALYINFFSLIEKSDSTGAKKVLDQMRKLYSDYPELAFLQK